MQPDRKEARVSSRGHSAKIITNDRRDKERWKGRRGLRTASLHSHQLWCWVQARLDLTICQISNKN